MAVNKPLFWIGTAVGVLYLFQRSNTGDKIISGAIGMEPRGIRNNNPGNIRWNANNNWDGQVGQDANGFAIFSAPEYGIRAIAKVINAKWDRGLRTINDIIGDYAPPTENLTGAYVNHVARAVGVDPNATISKQWLFVHMPEIVSAIIMHENGKQPYTIAQIDNGLSMV
jgi:hypothetical protein